MWLCIHSEKWKSEGTPLWLWFNSADWDILHRVGEKLPGFPHEGGYVPVEARLDVVMEAVVDDIARRLKDIADSVGVSEDLQS